MSKIKEMWEAVKFQRCQKCEYAKKVSRYTIYCPFFSCMQTTNYPVNASHPSVKRRFYKSF